jgi:hypothetical protein
MRANTVFLHGGMLDTVHVGVQGVKPQAVRNRRLGPTRNSRAGVERLQERHRCLNRHWANLSLGMQDYCDEKKEAGHLSGQT